MHHNAKNNISPPARILTLSLVKQKTVKRMIIASVTTAFLLFALLWAQNSWAADKFTKINENPEIQQEAADFIQRLADKALTTLNQKDYSLADQENRFSEILDEGFDVKYIGRISLGRHKKRATKENLDTYYSIFPQYLIKVYTSRLTKLDTREVNVGKVLPNGKRDMYVRTKVIDDEEKSFDVDWRVRPKKKEDNGEVPSNLDYNIIDVKIEGISMARTQRDDFAARINESGMTGLIDFMQDIIDGNIEIPDEELKAEVTQTQ